jgi:hypothetical protein
MTVENWNIVIGVVVSAALALAPWMFMVHAKLAVLGSQLARLEAMVGKLIEANEERLPMCARHVARLETHDVQIAQLCERLRQME